MRLRRLLPIALALCWTAHPRASAEQQVWDLFGSLASALTNGNDGAFLDGFDPAMQGYQKFSADVTTLVREAGVDSSIEPGDNQGDDRIRTVEMDWILSIDRRRDGIATVRRHKTVKCRLEKQGKRWRIVSFDPIDFFTPPPA